MQVGNEGLLGSGEAMPYTVTGQLIRGRMEGPERPHHSNCERLGTGEDGFVSGKTK